MKYIRQYVYTVYQKNDPTLKRYSSVDFDDIWQKYPKDYEIKQKLLLTAYVKSYMTNRLVPK